jgi:predicted transposase YbfD/YdcC
MPTMPDGSLLSHFSSLPDPRIERTRAHPLVNILVITICAVICGADDWVSVVSYGRSKASWLAGFLDMSNGIPSHDTFGRVFSLLDPNELQSCFVSWIKSVAKLTDGEVVAIDGKKLNGSADAPKGHYAIHMVSAWACENRLVLGQLRVDEKSNEMKAVPQLLDLLDLSGCIVTLDAMSTHREIAAAIHAHAADYVLPLKENQPTLRTAVAEYFDYAEQADSRHRPALHRARTVDNEHGRLEVREYFLTDAIDWLPGVTGKELWPGTALDRHGAHAAHHQRQAEQRCALLPHLAACRRTQVRWRRAQPLVHREPTALGARRRLRRGQQPLSHWT